MTINEDVHILDVLKTALNHDKIHLSEEAKERVSHCFHYLQEKITTTESPIYGINTGFGSLCNTIIESDDLEQLQKNLLMSHACGMGEAVDEDIVRIMLIIKVLSLTKGHSGVQPATVDKLVNLYNNNQLPVVYEQGSLGASGDLAPLAHLALPLLGLGEIWQDGKITSAAALTDPSYHLKAKEGLALINGTQFMAAYGTYCVGLGLKLVHLANQVAAMSTEAYDGRIEPFMPHSHLIRNQKGQQICAAEMYELLHDSAMQAQEKQHVQDPYSFRCSPQVHGATLDALNNAAQIIDDEVNAVTDNPNVFPEEDLILSAGNFHGQTLAIQLDSIAIALAELANISERRTYKLISGQRGLPAFLIPEPGLNSGYMIPQYTAASIVSQNKQLCTPASVDSIVSSNGQEDHVSMGANAATKCYRVLHNTIRVLGIEVMAAAQALELRRPEKSSDAIESLHTDIRKKVDFIQQDTVMYTEMRKATEFVKEYLNA